jgi:hypothetical protein
MASTELATKMGTMVHLLFRCVGIGNWASSLALANQGLGEHQRVLAREGRAPCRAVARPDKALKQEKKTVGYR